LDHNTANTSIGGVCFFFDVIIPVTTIPGHVGIVIGIVLSSSSINLAA
jgi:hypothetical protein